MKRYLNLLIVLVLLAIFYCYESNTPKILKNECNIQSGKLNIGKRAENNGIAQFKQKLESKRITKKVYRVRGSDLQKKFFSNWFYPYGNRVPAEIMRDMWREIDLMPSEPENCLEKKGLKESMVWKNLGPSVNYNTGNQFYSGRVKHIEMYPVLRYAPATGGLWNYGYDTRPISNSINSMVIGGFATKPDNQDVIIVGTGEPTTISGDGLWRTVDGGLNWNQIPLLRPPRSFYKVKFSPLNNNKVYAASDKGLYISYNNGNNFYLLTGTDYYFVTDFVFHPIDSNIVYISKFWDRIQKSTDGGNSFIDIDNIPVNIGNRYRTSLTLNRMNPNTIYALIYGLEYVPPPVNQLVPKTWVYKSYDAGANWSNVTPSQNLCGGQGEYNQAIAVCPTDSNLIYAGGVDLYKSTNGGTNWTNVMSSTGIHPDIHSIVFSDNGNEIYVGHDGGVSHSIDKGVTWDHLECNRIVASQFVAFDISKFDPAIMMGGTQDNGVLMTTNFGQDWKVAMTGDGGGVALSPDSAHIMFLCIGAYSTGGSDFRRFISRNKGLSWTDIQNGLDDSHDWWNRMKYDGTNLFSHVNRHVVYSPNEGGYWVKQNINPFSAAVYNLNLAAKAYGPVVYACLDAYTGTRLQVYDGISTFAFRDRTAGLPDSSRLRTVATHPKNPNIAFALIEGIRASIHGRKIFRTTNKGENWQNITGNLPNIPLSDLVAHPTNDSILVLGTAFGCFKTTNMGTTWFKWNNGMPKANLMTEMSFIDSSSINGNFYIIAASYGRSIWIRNINDIENPLIRKYTFVSVNKVPPKYPNGTLELQVFIKRAPFTDNYSLKKAKITFNFNSQALLFKEIFPYSYFDSLTSPGYNKIRAELGQGTRLSIIASSADSSSVDLLDVPTDSVLLAHLQFQILDSSQLAGISWDPAESSIEDHLGEELINDIIFVDPGEIVLDVNDNILPNEYILYQNYPNPFNPKTTINYSIPERSMIQLKIFNSIGQLVSTLKEEEQNPGKYTIEWNAEKYASGVYILRLESYSKKEKTRFIKSQKMILIK